MEEIIKTVKEFGIALVKKQHRFFQNEHIENSEHVAAIRRIADTAYTYIKQRGANLDKAKEVKKELINHGKNLFVMKWMKMLEGEEPLGEEDRQEAMETFDELLKENGR
ncbi:MAG: hypothetical protein WCI64_10385 [Chlorobium sp.]